MNSEKTINGQTYHGPSLTLRGITSSQINTRHAFLIYLTFKIITLRNIEEEKEKRIPALCEALNSVEGTSNDVNMIDYECIANKTDDEDLTNYQLKEIDEGDNNGVLKKSNLKELASKKTLEDFLKREPEFTIEDLLKYVTFEMNQIENQKANNYIFDFKIEGKINKEMAPGSINADLELNEIEEKAGCNFVVEEDKITANLNCKMDITKYKDTHLFTFKTSEINTDNNDIFLAKLDEVSLINEEEEKKKIIQQ